MYNQRQNIEFMFHSMHSMHSMPLFHNELNMKLCICINSSREEERGNREGSLVNKSPTLTFSYLYAIISIVDNSSLRFLIERGQK